MLEYREAHLGGLGRPKSPQRSAQQIGQLNLFEGNGLSYPHASTGNNDVITPQQQAKGRASENCLSICNF